MAVITVADTASHHLLLAPSPLLLVCGVCVCFCGVGPHVYIHVETESRYQMSSSMRQALLQNLELIGLNCLTSDLWKSTSLHSPVWHLQARAPTLSFYMGVTSHSSCVHDKHCTNGDISTALLLFSGPVTVYGAHTQNPAPSYIWPTSQ